MQRRRWFHHGNERMVLVCSRFVYKFAIEPRAWLRRITRSAAFCATELRRNSRFNPTRYLRASLGLAWHCQQKALASNRREYRLSGSPLRAWIAPVRISFNGFCIVAERATMIRADDEAGYAHICRIRDRVVRLWRAQYPDRDLDEIVSDLYHTFHDSNFGYLDGRLVLVDYGAEALEMLFLAAPDEFLRCFEEAAAAAPVRT
ncbi:hypothetical protein HY634_03205 [Candidatus Uhrbacteria bacterium]|nr:hypothetical protein [Candidatus Uhrbacteria bacterium]